MSPYKWSVLKEEYKEEFEVFLRTLSQSQNLSI